MPLRTRLTLASETVQDFEIAADERFEEGLELLTLGRLGAGIYLLGYAAEMLLKNACYRFAGADLTDPVAGFWGPALARGRGYGLQPESSHSVRFWAYTLRADRVGAGQPLPMSTDAELCATVHRLYDNWWVEMRYRPDQALSAEAEEVLDDVGWLRSNYNALWS